MRMENMMNRDSEWKGDANNSVTELGPGRRKLSASEKLRLGRLTGQQDNPNAKPKPGFFNGVDPDYPWIEDK